MKSLQFLPLLLGLVFCTIGCVEQLETEFDELKTQTETPPEMRRHLNPEISSIVNYCDDRGNIEKVIVDGTKYASTVILDIFSEDETQHIVRYVKANPDGLIELEFIVGNPLDGSYGCSFLTAGTTYRIRVSPNPNIDPIWYSWDPWPLPNYLDGFTTIEPCTCLIRE